ncbi:MAG: hypothetical protein ACO1ON_09500 [Nocardioides sp.]
MPGPAGLAGGPTPAYADEAQLPGALSTALVERRTVLVPVPEGVVLRRLVGTVRVAAVEPGVPAPTGAGRLQVLVGDRVAETLPAQPRQMLRTVVRRSDLDRAGRLPVTLQWAGGCAPPGVAATLTDLRLLHGGAERAPSTERDFLGDAVNRVDVVVPGSARDDLLEAGLQVVALLSRRYGEDVPVAMATADAVLPRVGAGQRVVRLEPGGSLSRGIEQRFGLWTLALRGPGPELVEVVRAAVRDSGQSSVQSGEPRTLEDLGTPAATLAGWGTTVLEVPLPRDLLGGPGIDLDVRLVGSRTAVADGTTARVDVRVDGVLLESRDLAADEGSTLDLPITVPADRVGPGSTLEISLTAAPAGGCAEATSTLPVSVELDGARSTVTPVAPDEPDATPRAGLDRFPAALDGRLPVGVATDGRSRVTETMRAARLVAALQRLAGLPLAIELVDADDLLADDRPGLLVGADDQDTLAVQAPVALEAGGGLDALPLDEPFAALQAVRHRDRDLLLLGAWAPREARADVGPLVDRLLDRVTDRGAPAWTGGAVVLPGSGDPITTDPAPPSDPTTEPERENAYAPYLVAAAVVLGLLLVTQVVAMVRRERRRRATTATGASGSR